MFIYYAGFNYKIFGLKENIKLNVLESFANIKKINDREKYDKYFLDSGAFSAWSRGISININNYIKFIKENNNIIDYYAVLDSIGDPEKTLNNQKIMEKEELNPIPCFHYGEDIKYLKYYLNKYEYVALGGMVPISNKNLTIWLDELFGKYICNSNGYPKIKIHGFGITIFKLLIRYPWYSIDSTTWKKRSIYGEILMPVFNNNEFNYIKGQKLLSFSTSNHRSYLKSNIFDNMHYFNITEEKRKIIDLYINFIDEKVGKSEFINGKEIIIEEGLCNNGKIRDNANIKYFLKLQEKIPSYSENKFIINNKSIFII